MRLRLVDTMPSPIAPRAQNCPGGALFRAPGGRFVGLPTGRAVAVHEAVSGFPLRATLPFPDDVLLPERPLDHGDRAEGVQAGALSADGTRLALATHDELILDGARRATDPEKEGEPDALAFAPDGQTLWLSSTAPGADARVSALAVADLAAVGSVSTGPYPDPGWFEIHPHPSGRGALLILLCGQDGCGARGVTAADGGALVLAPPSFFEDNAPLAFAGWLDGGDRFVLLHRDVVHVRDWRSGVVVAEAEGGDFLGAVVGDHILVQELPPPAGAMRVRILEPAGLTVVGADDVDGEWIVGLADGHVLAVARDALRLYRLER